MKPSLVPLLISLLLTDQSQALTVTSEPWVDPQLVQQQIQPFLDRFNLTFKGQYSIQQLANTVKKQEVDLLYLGTYYHDFMIENGYRPVLTSLKDSYITEAFHCKANTSQFTEYYYLGTDLYSVSQVLSRKSDPLTFIKFPTTESIIITLLGKPSAVGLISPLEMNLLPDSLKASLCTRNRVDIGPLVLYALNSKRADIDSQLEAMIDYHHAFQSESKEYIYLDYYRFKHYEQKDNSRFISGSIYKSMLNKIEN